MKQSVNMHRRRLLQAAGAVPVAYAASPMLMDQAFASARVEATSALRADMLSVAIVQSRAQSLSDLLREVDRVCHQTSPKHLICFPVLSEETSGLNNAAVHALVNQAVAYDLYIAFGISAHGGPQYGLATPHGELRTSADADPHVHHTDIGAIAMLSVHNAPDLYRVAADLGAEIVLRLSAGPLALWDAKARTIENRTFTIAATSVGDSFLQASGSVILAPNGETLAAAGAAWTQTVSADLPLAHHRAVRFIGA